MKRPPAWIRLARCALLLAGVAAVGSCAGKPGVLFPPLDNPVVFPPTPEQARIKYVGQLATSADLKPAVPFTENIGAALFGKKAVKSMLTPYALCTDGGDRLFVADTNAQVVHVFDLNKRTYQQWKPPAKGAPSFSQPVGLAWNSSWKQLFVADSVGGRIFVFDTDGKYVSQIGGSFVTRPCGLAIEAKTGRLFVADAAVHQIIVLSSDGRLEARIGDRGTGLGQFNFPTNVAVDSAGNLYVSDTLNFRVQKFGPAPSFTPLKQIGRKGDMPGYFGQPKGMAIDSQDHLYVVDANFETVQLFNSEGQVLMDFGEEGTGPGQFWLPAGIFIDPKDRIWIADSYNRRVQVFDYLATPESKAQVKAESKP